MASAFLPSFLPMQGQDHLDSSRLNSSKNIDLKSLAEMAELADALDSGSSARKGVEVRVLFSA